MSKQVRATEIGKCRGRCNDTIPLDAIAAHVSKRQADYKVACVRASRLGASLAQSNIVELRTLAKLAEELVALRKMLGECGEALDTDQPGIAGIIVSRMEARLTALDAPAETRPVITEADAANMDCPFPPGDDL